MDESKKLKEKELETELVSNLSFEQTTTKIAEYLYQYTLRTQQYYHKQNPRILGNVAFWLEEKNAQMILMYNVHPNQWNINRVVFDLEYAEKHFYETQYQGAIGG
jgi:hypothetical protein